MPLARQADQLIGLRAPRYQTEQLEVAVIEAVGDALSGADAADLLIADEAHRLAGREGKPFQACCAMKW